MQICAFPKFVSVLLFLIWTVNPEVLDLRIVLLCDL